MQPEVLSHFLAAKAEDMKAVDLVTLDVTGKSNITDYLIICTGTSKKHLASIADYVADESRKMGVEPFAITGEKDGEWVVLDLGSSMLHIMQAEPRATYQLEKLWS